MSYNDEPQMSYMSLGTSVGMLVGGVLGVILWIITDTFVFFPVFIGAGLSVGVSIGNAIHQRSRGETPQRVAGGSRIGLLIAFALALVIGLVGFTIGLVIYLR